MLNKSRKDFIISVLRHILSIKGRINFLQLGRFSPLCEQTYRNQFKKEFDFLSFNKQLINQTVSAESAIALDPSYVPKAGKATYGRGRYWSGVASKWPELARIAIGHEWLKPEEMKELEELEEKYTPEIVTNIGEMAKKVGGHGGMDFMMNILSIILHL